MPSADAWLYPFFAEPEPRRDRAVLRPVVTISFEGFDGIVVDALFDSGSDHVLADASIADALGIDLTNAFDSEPLGIAGAVVEARFAAVNALLIPWVPHDIAPIEWSLDVGFIKAWLPLYPVILGNRGFFDQFTVSLSRFAQTTAVEPSTTFDERFGVLPPASKR